MNQSQLFIFVAALAAFTGLVWIVGFKFGVRWTLAKHDECTAASKARGEK